MTGLGVRRYARWVGHGPRVALLSHASGEGGSKERGGGGGGGMPAFNSDSESKQLSKLLKEVQG